MPQFGVYWERLQDFYGRDALLEAVHDYVFQTIGGQHVAALCGEDGIGKTQVAVEYAYRYREAYRGGVYWVNALNDWTYELAAIAHQIGLKPARPVFSALQRDRWLTVALQRYLADDLEEPMLIIFDNVINPRHILDREVGPGLYVADMTAHMLITTQVSDSPEMPDNFRVFQVEMIPVEEARQLLSEVNLIPLADTIGRLPLVLKLIKTAGTTDIALDSDPLTAILQWHHAHLESDNARMVWNLAAAFRRESIIARARLQLMSGLPTDRFEIAIKTLHQKGLIELLGDGSIELHARVRDFIRTHIPNYRATLYSMIDRLISALRDPATLYEQASQRGIRAVQIDLLEAHIAMLEDGSPSEALTQLLRFLEWEGDYEPAQLIQQLRERAHHQGDAALRSACDHWLQGKPHFITEAAWRYPRNPSVLRTLIGHEARISDVIRLDGQYFLTAAYDTTLRLWDSYAGQTLRVLHGHSGHVTAIAQLDADHVLSGATDNTIRLWNLHSGATLKIFRGHEWPITALVTIDADHVVSASSDDTLRLWKISTGETVRQFVGHKDPVTSVARWDDRHILSASYDNTVRLWNLYSGQNVLCYEGHTGTVTAVAKVDDEHFLTASADKTLQLWRADTGEVVQVLIGHTWPVLDVIVLNPQIAVSASGDHTLYIWNLETGELVRVLEGHQRAVTGLAQIDQQRVVSVSADLTVRVWDVLAEQPPQQTPREHLDWVTAIVPLTEAIAISTSIDHTLRLWEDEHVIQILRGHQDGVNGVAILDEGHLVSASSDGTLRVWDLATGAPIQTLKNHHEEVMAVVALDSRRVVSGDSDGQLRVWEVATGETLSILNGHQGTVTTLANLSAGYVVSGASDDSLRVWEVATGNVVRVLHGHTATVRAIAVVNETMVISASHDRTLRLWDLETGETVRILEGHHDWVTTVVMMDDSHCLSGSFDRTLRLWNIQTGQLIAQLAIEEPILSLAHLGNWRVMVGDLAGKVRVIRVL